MLQGWGLEGGGLGLADLRFAIRSTKVGGGGWLEACHVAAP